MSYGLTIFSPYEPPLEVSLCRRVAVPQAALVEGPRAGRRGAPARQGPAGPVRPGCSRSANSRAQQFPGGVLIDLPHTAVEERLAATQAALDAGAPAIFEASFLAGDVFVAVDVLLRTENGFSLIEVKSSTSVKDEHIPDAAIQTWVLRQAGLSISSVQIMHLNKEYRHPGHGELLVQEDVTDAGGGLPAGRAGLVEEQLQVIAGTAPGLLNRTPLLRAAGMPVPRPLLAGRPATHLDALPRWAEDDRQLPPQWRAPDPGHSAWHEAPRGGSAAGPGAQGGAAHRRAQSWRRPWSRSRARSDSSISRP